MQRQSEDGGKPQDDGRHDGVRQPVEPVLSMLVTTDLIESIRPFIIAGKTNE